MTRLVAGLLFVALLSGVPATDDPASADVERYHLQSNAWVNLHQRLMYEARFGDAPPPDGLAGDDLAAWNAAVAQYKTWLGARRSPIFDSELVALNRALSETKVGSRAAAHLPKGIPEAAAKALDAARPLYDRGQWARDDAANRFWIAGAAPLLRSAAAELIAAHEKAYGVPFPKKIRVDVVSYGWEFGAYTVGDGDAVHSVIQSTDAGSQGFAALEALMHEPSHGIVASDSGAIGADLAHAAAELHVKPPYNLWHALLFYTSGELTRRVLAERGVTTYTPVIQIGMFDRQFKGFREAFDQHWRAWLDGKTTREEAMRAIVQATSKPGP
ncbi:MAG TPA: hypothetical protein VFQ07_13465 [Candidatus Polarisedimenticolia bacterium]|nr:hypothetical protein [Candidatus Polarisedimenticolia bacterium]